MSDLAQGVQVQFKAGNKVQPHVGYSAALKIQKQMRIMNINQLNGVKWKRKWQNAPRKLRYSRIPSCSRKALLKCQDTIEKGILIIKHKKIKKKLTV